MFKVEHKKNPIRCYIVAKKNIVKLLIGNSLLISNNITYIIQNKKKKEFTSKFIKKKN